MGMFDTIKTSYDLGPGFYNKSLQTKGLDNLMEFYWIDPAGCLFKVEYSGTQAWEMKPLEDSMSEWDIFKIVPNGTHGKVSPCNLTKTIEVYPERWDAHYSSLPRKEITFFAGMLVVDGLGKPTSQEKIWETRYLSLKKWVENNSEQSP
jgi:hypothetical protein